MNMSRMKTELQAAAGSITTDAESGKYSGEFRLPPTFCGFSGHFPGRAVLPAIAQMLMAELLAEEVAGGALRLTGVVAAKFLIVLGPDQQITVTGRPRTVDHGFALDAQVLCDEGVAAKFRLSFDTIV